MGRSQPLADLEVALTACLGPGAEVASQTPPRWAIAGMGGPAEKDTA
ncbi:MAG: hypothetical protein KJ069_10300 [Anaerolineae bacterium]|nr:hypothetical protein [Anaerolineae bacterium]